MDADTKHPLASKTIWATAFQLIASILLATGVIHADQADILTGLGPDVVVGLVGAIFAVMAAWGRVSATKTLSRKKVDN